VRQPLRRPGRVDVLDEEGAAVDAPLDEVRDLPELVVAATVRGPAGAGVGGRAQGYDERERDQASQEGDEAIRAHEASRV
jgi:hypothetical protein